MHTLLFLLLLLSSNCYASIFDAPTMTREELLRIERTYIANDARNSVASMYQNYVNLLNRIWANPNFTAQEIFDSYGPDAISLFIDAQQTKEFILSKNPAMALPNPPLDFQLNADGTVIVAPLITTQPEAQVKVVGERVEFSVVASGAGTITYQWQKDGQSIDGAVSNVLVIESVSLQDAGTYTVIVSNVKSTVSAGAILTVNP